MLQWRSLARLYYSCMVCFRKSLIACLWFFKPALNITYCILITLQYGTISQQHVVKSVLKFYFNGKINGKIFTLRQLWKALTWVVTCYISANRSTVQYSDSRSTTSVRFPTIWWRILFVLYSKSSCIISKGYCMSKSEEGNMSVCPLDTAW